MMVRSMLGTHRRQAGLRRGMLPLVSHPGMLPLVSHPVMLPPALAQHPVPPPPALRQGLPSEPRAISDGMKNLGPAYAKLKGLKTKLDFETLYSEWSNMQSYLKEGSEPPQVTMRVLLTGRAAQDLGYQPLVEAWGQPGATGEPQGPISLKAAFAMGRERNLDWTGKKANLDVQKVLTAAAEVEQLQDQNSPNRQHTLNPRTRHAFDGSPPPKVHVGHPKHVADALVAPLDWQLDPDAESFTAKQAGHILNLVAHGSMGVWGRRPRLVGEAPSDPSLVGETHSRVRAHTACGTRKITR